MEKNTDLTDGKKGHRREDFEAPTGPMARDDFAAGEAEDLHRRKPDNSDGRASRDGDGSRTTNNQPRDDRFDVSRLRLSQNFVPEVGPQKVITSIPVRKPHRQEFVRVHPDKNYHLATAVIEVAADRETYLVASKLWDELSAEIVSKNLLTTINRKNALFLWPIRLPGDDGRIDGWNASALAAANEVMQGWARVTSNHARGAYDVFKPRGTFPEPEWPDLPFDQILKIAFDKYYIDSLDHPVVKKLRGIE